MEWNRGIAMVIPCYKVTGRSWYCWLKSVPKLIASTVLMMRAQTAVAT